MLLLGSGATASPYYRRFCLGKATLDEVPDERSIRISRTQKYLPLYEGALKRDFKEFTTPEDPLHVGEYLSQKKGSCRYTGLCIYPASFRGLPKKFGSKKQKFRVCATKIAFTPMQNNANALFCLASQESARRGVLRDLRQSAPEGTRCPLQKLQKRDSWA